MTTFKNRRKRFIIGYRFSIGELGYQFDDFFDGSCEKLVEAAKLQDKFIKEHNEKAQEEYNNHFDHMTKQICLVGKN